MTLLRQLDTALFSLINHLPHNAVSDTIAAAIHYLTRYGFIYYPVFVYFFFLKDRHRRAFARFGALSGVATHIVVQHILKSVINRARPFQILDNVVLLAPVPQSCSFPSAQTAVAFSLASLYFFFPFRVLERYAALFFALLVGLDRVYMGHHYPSDVLGGAALGILISYLTVRLSHVNWKMLNTLAL